MKLNTNYNFSKDNTVGQSSGKLQTPLVEAKTVKDQPVVTLCQADSFVPRKDGAALVTRDSEGNWQPISTMDQLQKTMASTPKDKLGETVGIWTDSRNWLVMPKDGVPQEREVQSLQSHWDENSMSTTRRYDDLGVRNGDANEVPQQMTVGWSIADSTVRPTEVAIAPASFPGKQVGVLQEPLYVSSHETLRVTDFDDQSYQYTPTAVESTKHTAAGSKVTANAEYDLAPLLFDTNTTDYVIAV